MSAAAAPGRPFQLRPPAALGASSSMSTSGGGGGGGGSSSGGNAAARLLTPPPPPAARALASFRPQDAASAQAAHQLFALAASTSASRGGTPNAAAGASRGRKPAGASTSYQERHSQQQQQQTASSASATLSPAAALRLLALGDSRGGRNEAALAASRRSTADDISSNTNNKMSASTSRAAMMLFPMPPTLPGQISALAGWRLALLCCPTDAPRDELEQVLVKASRLPPAPDAPTAAAHVSRPVGPTTAHLSLSEEQIVSVLLPWLIGRGTAATTPLQPSSSSSAPAAPAGPTRGGALSSSGEDVDAGGGDGATTTLTWHITRTCHAAGEVARHPRNAEAERLASAMLKHEGGLLELFRQAVDATQTRDSSFSSSTSANRLDRVSEAGWRSLLKKLDVFPTIVSVADVKRSFDFALVSPLVAYAFPDRLRPHFHHQSHKQQQQQPTPGHGDSVSVSFQSEASSEVHFDEEQSHERDAARFPSAFAVDERHSPSRLRAASASALQNASALFNATTATTAAPPSTGSGSGSPPAPSSSMNPQQHQDAQQQQQQQSTSQVVPPVLVQPSGLCFVAFVEALMRLAIGLPDSQVQRVLDAIREATGDDVSAAVQQSEKALAKFNLLLAWINASPELPHAIFDVPKLQPSASSAGGAAGRRRHHHQDATQGTVARDGGPRNHANHNNNNNMSGSLLLQDGGHQSRSQLLPLKHVQEEEDDDDRHRRHRRGATPTSPPTSAAAASRAGGALSSAMQRGVMMASSDGGHHRRSTSNPPAPLRAADSSVPAAASSHHHRSTSVPAAQLRVDLSGNHNNNNTTINTSGQHNISSGHYRYHDTANVDPTHQHMQTRLLPTWPGIAPRVRVALSYDAARLRIAAVDRDKMSCAGNHGRDSEASSASSSDGERRAAAANSTNDNNSSRTSAFATSQDQLVMGGGGYFGASAVRAAVSQAINTSRDPEEHFGRILAAVAPHMHPQPWLEASGEGPASSSASKTSAAAAAPSPPGSPAGSPQRPPDKEPRVVGLAALRLYMGPPPPPAKLATAARQPRVPAAAAEPHSQSLLLDDPLANGSADGSTSSSSSMRPPPRFCAVASSVVTLCGTLNVAVTSPPELAHAGRFKKVYDRLAVDVYTCGARDAAWRHLDTVPAQLRPPQQQAGGTTTINESGATVVMGGGDATTTLSSTRGTASSTGSGHYAAPTVASLQAQRDRSRSPAKGQRPSPLQSRRRRSQSPPAAAPNGHQLQYSSGQPSPNSGGPEPLTIVSLAFRARLRLPSREDAGGTAAGGVGDTGMLTTLRLRFQVTRRDEIRDVTSSAKKPRTVIALRTFKDPRPISLRLRLFRNDDDLARFERDPEFGPSREDAAVALGSIPSHSMRVAARQVIWEPIVEMGGFDTGSPTMQTLGNGNGLARVRPVV